MLLLYLKVKQAVDELCPAQDQLAWPELSSKVELYLYLSKPRSANSLDSVQTHQAVLLGIVDLGVNQDMGPD